MVEFTCWVCGHLFGWSPVTMANSDVYFIYTPWNLSETHYWCFHRYLTIKPLLFFSGPIRSKVWREITLWSVLSWLYESLCPELPCLVISTIHRKFMDFVMHFNFTTIVVADVHIFLNFSLKMKLWNENLRRNLADWPKWGEYLKRGVFL